MKRTTAVVFTSAFILLGLHTPNSAEAASADLSLSPVTQTINIGEQADILVDLNTGGATTAATDLSVTYDASKLILLDILPGTIYDQYTGEEINDATGKGAITGLASSSQSVFNGNDTFATLRFKGIGGGTSSVTIDFTLGQRNDSNVSDFQTNEDILATTTNASVTVLGAAPTLTPTRFPTPTLTNDASNLPQTAAALPTYIISVASLSFIGIGSYLYRRFR